MASKSALASKESSGSKRAARKSPGRDNASAREDVVSVDANLTLLEKTHKKAAIFAVGDNALVVPIPESLDPHGQELATIPFGTTALDIVVPESKVVLIEAWERVRHASHSTATVKLKEEPNRTTTVEFFDARDRYGLYIGLLYTADRGKEDEEADARASDFTHRVAHIHKDELALVIEVDDAFTEILGWAPEDVVGKRTLELIHPDDQEMALDSWVDMLAAPGLTRRTRLRHLHRDSSWVWLKVSNHNLLEDSAYRCVVGELEDISDEMATREALRAKEELLDRLAEAMPIGLLHVDANSRVVYTNDSLHSIIGLARAETLEEQLATVVEADRSLAEDAFSSVLSSGVDTYVEVRVRPARGRSRALRYCSFNLRALTDAVGGVGGAIVLVDNVTDRVKARKELHARATFDAVTQCYNRSSTMSALERMITSDHEGGEPAAIFIDLDRFKEINDVHGHAAGDEFLQVIAERLKRRVRGQDVVGRIGGDEFLVLCPGLPSSDEAVKTASRLARALRNPIRLKAGAVPSRASVGVAWSQNPEITAKELVVQADAAMYVSKRDGEGMPVLFDESMAEFMDPEHGHYSPSPPKTAS
jgi:diguanylate cyclase (GGDEF)-like protein/PAS domain S-box-containing protein